ncbi:MAG: hypothetical protein ACM3XZ_00635 [Betaproteobacteria bacterium]
MSAYAWWVVAAFFLDWWTGGALDNKPPWMLAAGAVTTLGGALVGCWLGRGLPTAGAALLGAGILGCLGLVHLAESASFIPTGPAADCGLLGRALLGAAGIVLLGLGVAQTLAVLLTAMAGGFGASLLWGKAARRSGRGVRFLAGLSLTIVCLVTFRGAI